MTAGVRPWAALGALCVGFFMILLDSTIVAVATPDIMRDLDADINQAVWLTSAYLLAFAVPLLITGRLGDRFGQRPVYLIGLLAFTATSVWCGFAPDAESLIVARVMQGLAASVMSPQAMSVITRVFPPIRRGAAMGVWGVVGGVATFTGPILGGLIVDFLGWEWIFFVNVPLGAIAFLLAVRYVPDLPTHVHRFDLIGVGLSAVGMFLLVFGVQEGHTFNWGAIVGPITVSMVIGTGLLIMIVFVLWQKKTKGESLVPLSLFGDRNFALSTVAISTVGFAITGMALPIMLYAQTVRDLTPTQAGLLLAPMAILSGALAPVVGRLTDAMNPRTLAVIGLLSFALSLAWLGTAMTPDASILYLCAPMSALGISTAMVWTPLGVTATRNLEQGVAGAGSGVYNTTRQVGAVLGSAAVGMIMQVRIIAELGSAQQAAAIAADATLSEAAQAGFSAAMGQALFLPAAVLLIGMIAAAFFVNPAAEPRVRGL